MYKKLINIQKNSYSKITKFPVAAILVTNDNKEFVGVNVESDIMSSSICAERNAIFSAIALGADPNTFKAIHILGGVDRDYIITPCGVCRQLIFEFSPLIMINMYSKNGKSKRCLVKDLLPSGFRKEKGE